MIDPELPPEALWRMKLELDVLEECRGEPATLDDLVESFTDEDGDSTTSREELASIIDTLSRAGQIAFADARWKITAAGLQRLREEWPGFRD